MTKIQFIIEMIKLIGILLFVFFLVWLFFFWLWESWKIALAITLGLAVISFGASFLTFEL